jgi:hypothetical protein
MTRWGIVVAVVALLAGVLGGYVWWGRSLGDMRAEVEQARQQQADADGLRTEMKSLEVRLKATEDELREERDRRQKLEMIISQGRK